MLTGLAMVAALALAVWLWPYLVARPANQMSSAWLRAHQANTEGDQP